MIVFRKLTIENFFSVDKAIVPLDVNRPVLVVGEVKGETSAFSSNGAGKSSIFNALVWALFGRTIRDIPSDENVIRNGTDTVTVTVDLERNGAPVRIVRSRKRGKSSVLHVLDEKDNDLIVAGTVVELSKRVEQEIMGCSFDVFCNTVYFPQGSFTFFTQANDADKKKIFDRLLSTDIFGHYEQQAKCKKIEIEGNLGLLSVDVRDAQNAIAARDATLKDLDREEQEARDKYERGRNHIVEAPEVSSEALERQIEVQTRLRDKIKLRDVSTKKSYAACDAALKEWQRFKNDLLEAQKWAVARRGMIAKNQCPTCLQGITDKEGMEAEIVERLTKAEDLENEYRRRAEKAGKEYNADKEAETQAIADRRRYEDIDTKIAQLGMQLRTAQGVEMMRKAGETEIVARLDEAVASITARRKKAKVEKKELAAKLTEYTEQVERLQERLDRVKFWITGFGPRGIRSLIYENLLPFVNERANHYSSLLTGGNIEITVSATTRLKSGEDREKISVLAINREGASVYEANSGGERKRIDLCILLALQDLMVSRNDSGINLSIYDELLDELDEEGIERVVELLKERGRTQPLFLISHNDALQGYFEDTINVTKVDGVSKISLKS